MVRTCRVCKVDKPLTDYYNDRRSPGGRSTWCKPCQKQWRTTNTVRRCKRARELKRAKWDENPKLAWVLRAYQSASSHAKQCNVPFTVTKADIAWVVEDICPVFGTPLRYERGSGQRTENSPSLDRVKPELGYAKGNIRVVSWRANRLKSDATVEELLAIVRYMSSKQPEFSL
jgi:hypothetical protein